MKIKNDQDSLQAVELLSKNLLTVKVICIKKKDNYNLCTIFPTAVIKYYMEGVPETYTALTKGNIQDLHTLINM